MPIKPKGQKERTPLVTRQTKVTVYTLRETATSKFIFEPIRTEVSQQSVFLFAEPDQAVFISSFSNTQIYVAYLSGLHPPPHHCCCQASSHLSKQPHLWPLSYPGDQWVCKKQNRTGTRLSTGANQTFAQDSSPRSRPFLSATALQI